MRIAGRAWKFGDGVCGDDGIIQFSRIGDLGTYDEPALKAMCFQFINPDFAKQVQPGDLIVAGHNFAHHSHPHVCVAIKASGVTAVVVESCDSGFMRKSLNIGVPVVICPGVTGLVQEFDTLEVDLAEGRVIHANSGRGLPVRPYSKRMLDTVRAGGLIPFLTAQYSASHAGGEPGGIRAE